MGGALEASDQVKTRRRPHGETVRCVRCFPRSTYPYDATRLHVTVATFDVLARGYLIFDAVPDPAVLHFTRAAKVRIMPELMSKLIEISSPFLIARAS